MVSFECNAIYVEDVEDRSNIPKGCNAMYVGDVEDVKDRSNTPKGCNAMYVEDVEDRSNTPIFDIFDIALIFCTVFNAFNAMYLNTSNIKQCALTHIDMHPLMYTQQIR